MFIGLCKKGHKSYTIDCQGVCWNCGRDLVWEVSIEDEKLFDLDKNFLIKPFTDKMYTISVAVCWVYRQTTPPIYRVPSISETCEILERKYSYKPYRCSMFGNAMEELG
jgi:hypothetical protein